VNEGNINLRMAKVIPIAAVIAASAFIGWRISAAVDYIADACFRDSIIGGVQPERGYAAGSYRGNRLSEQTHPISSS
jgi:hypothetical protein